MQSTPHPMRPVRFGVFEVDFEAGELRKSGMKVALQEQPFHVLTLLLENAGKLVSRDELQQKIWTADTFVEFDQGLNTAINKVRDALGDSAGSPRFIETVPRRGYRFLAPVEGVNGERPDFEALRSQAPPVPQNRRFPVRLAALTVALAAAVGVIAWERRHRPEPGPDLPLRKFDLVIADLTPETFPVISPDGQKIVYDVGTFSQRNQKLRVYRLDAGESYDVAGTEGGQRQFWSPDSEFIGFMKDWAVCKVPVRGGTPQVLYHTREREWLNGPGSWSQDGRFVAFTSDSAPHGGLYEVPASGGSSPKLLIQMSEKLSGLSWPHFVADGSGRSLVLYNVELFDATIILHNLDDGRRQVLTTGGWPAYSPTGHILFGPPSPSGFRGIWALPVSLKTLKATGGPFSIDPNGRNESVAKDGTLVYLKGGYPKQKHLVWLDRDGRKLSEIGQPQEDILVPSLSPDGRFVGVQGWESVFGSDVWIHDIARSTKTRLTFDPAFDSRAIWSPDGKEVAFLSNRNGKADTFIQRVDGSGEAKAVLPDDVPEDWSADGSVIIGSRGYLRRNPDGSSERKPFPVFDAPKLSPDGRFVAYCSHESARWEVYVQPFPQGRKWQVSTNGGRQPRWCRNGKELFYTKDDTLFAVAISTKPTFSMGATRNLFSHPSLDWPWNEPSYDVAADGNRFVMIEPVGAVPPLTIRVVQNWFSEFRDQKKANP
jgi:eukaryotic-like serine/threonine-protein kinase